MVSVVLPRSSGPGIFYFANITVDMNIQPVTMVLVPITSAALGFSKLQLGKVRSYSLHHVAAQSLASMSGDFFSVSES